METTFFFQVRALYLFSNILSVFLLVALWALPFRVTWSLDLPSQSAGPPDKVYEGDQPSDSALSE